MTDSETEEIINDIDHILRKIVKIENIKIVDNKCCIYIEHTKDIDGDLEEAIIKLWTAKYHLQEHIEKKDQDND